MSDVTQTTKHMTADEYLIAQNLPAYSELVRGKVIDINQPSPRHGRVCFRVAFALGKHVEKFDSGHVMHSGPAPEVVFEVLSKSDRWSSALNPPECSWAGHGSD